MREAPFTVVTRDDLDPLCPHCGEPITEVYSKGKGPGWFLFPRSTIFFCPHCRKVLGLGQSKMA
jgi:hypothetical protein